MEKVGNGRDRFAGFRAQHTLWCNLSDGVLSIEFTAPPAHSLSSGTIALLQEELERAVGNRNIKVIVLRSTGKIFCAGHDLKEMRSHREDNDGGKAFLDQLFDDCSKLMKSIVDHPKPVSSTVFSIITLPSEGMD